MKNIRVTVIETSHYEIELDNISAYTWLTGHVTPHALDHAHTEELARWIESEQPQELVDHMRGAINDLSTRSRISNIRQQWIAQVIDT